MTRALVLMPQRTQTGQRRYPTICSNAATRTVTNRLYRPGLGWERLARRATEAGVEAASGTRVLLRDDPNLVPLETLPGRNHYVFPPQEEPPWRWRVTPIFPG